MYYHRTDLSEGTGAAKSNNSEECMVCNYWFWVATGFRFQDSVWTDRHDLTMLCLNIGNIAIITVKGVDHCRINQEISKY